MPFSDKLLFLGLGIILAGCGDNQPDSNLTQPATKMSTEQQKTETAPKLGGGTMPKSGSRIPAPTVNPVSADGVRYEQVKNGLVAGFDQMGGYLAAFSESDGSQLWTLKVYDNKRDPDREGDVQDIFFKSMSLRDGGTLLIENEKGARFVVDPKNQNVTTVP